MRIIRHRLFSYPRLLLLGTIMLLGCGSPVFDKMLGREKRDEPVGPRIISLYPPASGFVLHDPSCQSKSVSGSFALAALSSQNTLPCDGRCTVHQTAVAYYAGDSQGTPIEPQQAASSATFFVQNVIRNTTHSWTIVEKGCVLDDRILDCRQMVTYENPDGIQPLRACHEDASYPRNTFESAMILVGEAIRQAKEVFENATQVPIPPIDLRINLVKYSDFQDKNGNHYRAYDVDNAYYDPTNSSISFLGQSQTMAHLGASPTYESRFVTVHEFAHHLQYSRFLKQSEKLGLSWVPVEHRVRIDVGSNSYDPKAQLLSNFYSAVSESYADMMSFYLQNQTFEKELSSIKILSNIRKMYQPIFTQSLTPKAINSTLIDCMLGGFARDECFKGTDDLRGFHNQGGVLSSVLHQIFNATLPSTSWHTHIAPLDYFLESLLNEDRPEFNMSDEDWPNRLFSPFKVALRKTLVRFGENTPERKQMFCKLAQELMPVLDSSHYAGWSCIDEQQNRFGN